MHQAFKFFALITALLASEGCAWQQWTWKSDGPGPRDGHSLLLLGRSVYLFGGRSDDIQAFHRPTTYEIENVNGSLGFRSYDQQPVRACPDGLTQQQCYNTTIGTYWNDVWRYDLDCDRFADLGCASQGWTLVKPHASLGGCRIFREELVCSHPSERHDHGASLFASGELLVWGGFSWKCDDYCDDEWMLDVSACRQNASQCDWQEEVPLGGRSAATGAQDPSPTEGGLAPGKRWRFATADNGQDLVYQFGGQRLWHGYATANSAANRWASTEQYPHGGLLDDLWAYNRSSKEWNQVLPQETCYEAPGRDWERRSDLRCTITWPSARASSAMAFQDGYIYLHGGFNAPVPYPHVDGRGAGSGTGRAASDGPAPHPTHPYYLEDLWRYTVSTGLWEQLPVPSGDAAPAPRRDHTLLAASHALLMFGGYGQNFFYGDTWMFNSSTGRWLQKDTFVHALFPSNCTSDVLKLPSGEDFVLQQSVLGEPTRSTPLDGQDGRADEAVKVLQPRRQAPGWDGCRDRLDGRADLPTQLQWLQPSQRYGYSAVFAPDPPSPGAPVSPFGLDGIALVYGGVSVLREDLPTVAVTRESAVAGDMWQLDVTSCPNNCSDSGDCWYGFCYCHDGYYGLDCSNVSCPGDYCYYDPHSHEQVCSHCCHTVHEHSEGAAGDYVLRERKVSCDASHPGESHGICDGFGQCQCAPPFVGHDCSIRDCPGGCSGRGACSLEFPVARCMCDAGWAGPSCEERLCLNNCSWPNGYCDEGNCICTMNPNPFNRTIDFEPFAGEDCSFVVPFAGASRQGVLSGGRGAVGGIVTVLAAVLMGAAVQSLMDISPRGIGGWYGNAERQPAFLVLSCPVAGEATDGRAAHQAARRALGSAARYQLVPRLRNLDVVFMEPAADRSSNDCWLASMVTLAEKTSVQLGSGRGLAIGAVRTGTPEKPKTMDFSRAISTPPALQSIIGMPLREVQVVGGHPGVLSDGSWVLKPLQTGIRAWREVCFYRWATIMQARRPDLRGIFPACKGVVRAIPYPVHRTKQSGADAERIAPRAHSNGKRAADTSGGHAVKLWHRTGPPLPVAPDVLPRDSLVALASLASSSLPSFGDVGTQARRATSAVAAQAETDGGDHTEPSVLVLPAWLEAELPRSVGRSAPPGPSRTTRPAADDLSSSSPPPSASTKQPSRAAPPGSAHPLCVEMEDITKNMRRPCLADLKVGLMTCGPDAAPAKQARSIERYPPQVISGYRITGLRVWQVREGDKGVSVGVEGGKGVSVGVECSAESKGDDTSRELGCEVVAVDTTIRRSSTLGRDRSRYRDRVSQQGEWKVHGRDYGKRWEARELPVGLGHFFWVPESSPGKGYVPEGGPSAGGMRRDAAGGLLREVRRLAVWSASQTTWRLFGTSILMAFEGGYRGGTSRPTGSGSGSGSDGDPMASTVQDPQCPCRARLIDFANAWPADKCDAVDEAILAQARVSLRQVEWLLKAGASSCGRVQSDLSIQLSSVAHAVDADRTIAATCLESLADPGVMVGLLNVCEALELILEGAVDRQVAVLVGDSGSDAWFR